MVYLTMPKSIVNRSHLINFIIFGILFLLVYSCVVFQPKINTVLENETFLENTYLVDTPGCRIDNIEVYSSEIKEYLYKFDPLKCTDKPLLTYTSRVGDKVLLNLNKEAFISYSRLKIECCYMNIKRNPIGPKADDNLSFSECIPFNDSIFVEEETVKVTCSNIFSTVYENVHAILKSPQRVQNFNHPNVILVGIDSMSHSNFIRTMPKTYRHLKSTGWINLKGYNKVEENTLPNFLALLAGVKFSFNTDSSRVDQTKELNFIWKMFKSYNYTTAFGEDTPNIGTFNTNGKGFITAPTDYYFRPYFLVADELQPKYLCLKPHCTGPEKTGIRMQNLILDFLNTTNQKTPAFGLFWMNTFSHEDVNCASSMDDDFEDFFKKVYNQGYLNNTIMIAYSDHGFRFGKLRVTSVGWAEERLPFIFIWLPEHFRKSYKLQYQNLLENTNRLTTPYDVYMTLQNIISLFNNNFNEQPAVGCPHCLSLFKKIKPDRTCNDAGIPQHYCACSRYEKADKFLPVAHKIADFFVTKLNDIIKTNGSVYGCEIYVLEKVSYLKKLVIKPNFEENYVIGISTNPEANFEATIKVTFEDCMQMSLLGINRLDRYAPTSYCAKGSFVQKYCYCKSIVKKLTNIFCNNKYCFL